MDSQGLSTVHELVKGNAEISQGGSVNTNNVSHGALKVGIEHTVVDQTLEGVQESGKGDGRGLESAKVVFVDTKLNLKLGSWISKNLRRK